MAKKSFASRFIPLIALICAVIFFVGSYIKGSLLVQKSEKEINPKKQIEEAQAKKYSLKEIDAKTGQIRWELTAKEGKTEHNLQVVLIKDIKAEVYKNNEIIFELTAPSAKANASTKEIYLLDEVIAKDKNGNFLLTSNQLALGMGTSIEAQKGFNIVLKNSGTVIGDNALVNDDQSKITVAGLKEANFKDLIISGNKVLIERNKNGDLIKATISEGGKVILKNLNNDSLSANTINWVKDGDIEAITNVTYTASDKVFKAGHLILKPNKTLYARNGVSIIHGQTKCFGDSLTYENNSLVVISGNPKALQGDKRITADKIVYNLNTNKVEAIGNVKTIVAQKIEKTQP